ncbi:MAG: hypothetical protein AABM66_07825 [Actinomycetota bacterium]
MAGYSGTPLVRKLGIAEGHRVAFARAPGEFLQTLGRLPDGVAVRTRVRRPLDVIVAFFTRRSQLERRFPSLAAALEPDGGLWVAWPKGSSGSPRT